MFLCKRALVSPIARRCSISSRATLQSRKNEGANLELEHISSSSTNKEERSRDSFHNKNEDYTFDSLFMFEGIQFWKRLPITRYENLCQLVVAILLSMCLFKRVPKTTDDKYLWQEVLKECWNRKHTWNSHPQVYNILSELSPSCSLKDQLFFMPANIGLGKPKNNSENQHYKPPSPKAANGTGNACRGFKLALSSLYLLLLSILIYSFHAHDWSQDEFSN